MINLVQIALLGFAATLVAGDLPPGSNRYLPPDPTKGYNYNKPSPQFPTVSRPTPSFPVTTRPTTSFPSVTPTRPSIPSFPPGPRPTPFPVNPVRPTPGLPDYNGQPTGNNGNTLTPNQEHHDHGDHHHHHHEPGMPFDFNYAVKDDSYGNDYSHNAISDGDVVRGEYRVQLPDGRLQIVQYTADWQHGFNAQVSYEGTPRYDVPRPSGTFNGY
ncbi:pro-resilin [Neodiprion lecontei]|uniref:Pro-resilin n=1 Tax=Neodiprion lecontei TaxID=441921 RepID=A0A6J0BMY4_NEOLC|nr:pro-resilin [Neodiprion lecontei]